MSNKISDGVKLLASLAALAMTVGGLLWATAQAHSDIDSNSTDISANKTEINQVKDDHTETLQRITRVETNTENIADDVDEINSKLDRLLERPR